jgi:predicted DNA-binding protein (MmcQ/YjbR family)
MVHATGLSRTEASQKFTQRREISPKLVFVHGDIEWVRKLCLSFPGATERVTWGADLTFRISEKIFAVTVLEPARVWLSFKCSPENFAELTERAGIIPAPYLARAQWVALESKEALQKEELAALLRESYELVFAKLPKKNQEALRKTKHRKATPVSRRSGKRKTRKRTS